MDASKQNYDPSLQDWADAYKPVDKALNKMFETRITNDNARQEQYELAVVSDLSLSTKQRIAGPLLILTNTSLWTRRSICLRCASPATTSGAL